MLTKDNPVNLIQLLASYRRVDFAQPLCARPKLKEIAETISNNCAATIRFADSMLRELRHDGEELFSICLLRKEAQDLRRKCLALAHRCNGNGADHELVTLRSQYDIFMSSVRHFFFLLDRDLAGRIDGAL